jgi:Tol biopolymer transport system component
MPTWSPDGTSLVWVEEDGGRLDIWLGAADGSSRRRLTDDDAREVRPAFSPDGGRVLFSANRAGTFDVFVLVLATGEVLPLTSDAADEQAPAWSPDGSSIAYVDMENGMRLRIVSADGSNDRAVDGAPAGAWWPAWSPDGSRLAYERGGVIFIVPAAGGTPERLAVPQLRVVLLPAWAPGNEILFVSDGDVYAASPDASSVRRLTETSREEFTPAWATDGAIAFQVSYWVDRASAID